MMKFSGNIIESETSNISRKIAITFEDNSNISKKLTKISDAFNSLNYKLTGDEEQLVDIAKNEKFKITTNDKLEAMVKLMCKYVKAKLRMCYNMQKIKINFEGNPSSVKKSNYLSALATNTNRESSKLLVIIPDRGIDASGVFSKPNLLYGGVRKGSMISLVESAANSEYNTIILNPKKLDHYSATEIIWQNLITSKSNSDQNNFSKSSNIIIVAHRNASLSVIKLMEKFKEDFKSRVSKIILINSSHNLMYTILSAEMRFEFENKVTNYILSSSPLGSQVYSYTESMEGCENRSCGTLTEGLEHYYITQEISKFFK